MGLVSAGVGLGLGAIGSGLSLVGGFRQADILDETINDARRLSKREAAIELANARADEKALILNSFRADVDASLQKDVADLQFFLDRRDARRRQGTIKATSVGAGLDPGGSELDVLVNQAFESEVALRSAQLETLTNVERFQLEASDLRAQAVGRRRQGRQRARRLLFTTNERTRALKQQATNLRTQTIVGGFDATRQLGVGLSSFRSGTQPTT